MCQEAQRTTGPAKFGEIWFPDEGPVGHGASSFWATMPFALGWFLISVLLVQSATTNRQKWRWSGTRRTRVPADRIDQEAVCTESPTPYILHDLGGDITFPTLYGVLYGAVIPSRGVGHGSEADP